MKIALLGYGKEGQATEKYLKKHDKDAKIDIFEHETPEQLRQRDYSSYDIIFRSPSVPPMGLKNESSVTKYFFDHCPCPIIGVTATKGKGTTCSFVKSLLDAHGADAYLVGNIGVPAIEVLDKLTAESVVVYEMSSFQLWDLEKSPHIAVLGMLEPDHLNVHKDYTDYLDAKSHITKYQTEGDYLIYFKNNPETVRIAKTSRARKITYPFGVSPTIMKNIHLIGEHNYFNAMAAIVVVASYLNISPDEYLQRYVSEISAGLSNFHGLPHRLEFIGEHDGVYYFDDNFATNVSSLKVALDSFTRDDLVLIIGGRDKTDYRDLPELYDTINRDNVKSVILIGESGHELAKRYGMDDDRFVLAESLEEAVETAHEEAKKLAKVKTTSNASSKRADEPEKPPIVLMSPGAASFDMFRDVYDRGDQYQKIVRNF